MCNCLRVKGDSVFFFFFFPFSVLFFSYLSIFCTAISDPISGGGFILCVNKLTALKAISYFKLLSLY